MIRFLIKRFLGLIVAIIIGVLFYGFYIESGRMFIVAFIGGMISMFVIRLFFRITRGDGLG